MKKYFLVGENISYSLSPFIYNYLFKIYGVDATYEIVEKNTASFPDFIRNYTHCGYEGGNITAPFKKVAYYLIDSDYDGGSLNLVYKNKGYNTDYLGIKNHYPENIHRVNLLGCGGAGRAIYKALEERKIKVKLIRNGSEEYEIKTTKNMENQQYEMSPIINTVPYNIPGYNYFDLNRKFDHSRSMDIIYNPLRTPLIEKTGSKYTGLYLLVWQAIESFKIFCDIDASEKKEKLIEILHKIYK